MNSVVQTARAGLSPSIGQLLKPTGSDTRSDAPFAAYLTSEIKRDQERKAKETDPEDDPRDQQEKLDEKWRNSPANRDPFESLAAAIYQASARPVEPPSTQGGSKEACEGSAVDKSTTTGPVASSACVADKSANAAATAGEKTNAADAKQAAAADVSPEGQQAAAQAAKSETFQAALNSKAAGALVTTDPSVATTAAQPNLMDLQVPAAAQAAAQSQEGEARSSAQQDPNQASNPASAATANQAAKTSAEAAKTAPTTDAAAAQAKLAEASGVRDVQVTLGSTNLAANALPSFESARLAEAQSKGMIWQVCQNVEDMLKNRQTSLRLMLNPENLGRIDLRLTSSSSGMGVSLIAQQPGTGQMLESQLAQLRQALTQAGIQLSHLSVGQQGSQASSDQPNRQSRNSSSGQSQPDALQPVMAERTGLNRMEPSQGYDYLA